jgi:sec-independent protein translocase protein TatB
MLPQLGFAEMMVLALLAIIVVGPKDLPKLMRTIGQMMAKIRAMGQEFKDAFDEMGAQDEIAKMRKELADLKEMGSIDNLTDGLESDMRALERDLNEAARGDVTKDTQSNPKTDLDKATDI